MSTAIINDINKLSPEFRKRFDPRWAEVKKKYPTAQVFETLRTQERQNRLYAQGRTRPWKIVTWTLTSNHKDWNAVDIIFDGKRSWPYDDIIEMAKKYGIRNLKPTETCHFELDDTKKFQDPKNPKTIEIREFMKSNWDSRHRAEKLKASVSKATQEELTEFQNHLKGINDYFRQFWF